MTDPRAPVFAAVRAEMPNVWNDAGNVLAMDNLLDALGFPRLSRGGFDAALNVILAHEGGFVNDPRDPGGMTNLGVTKDTWEAWTKRPASEADMRALTPAKVAPLYRDRYWNALRCDDLHPALALCVFDFGVNASVKRAARYLQAVVGAAQDGAVGPATVAAARAFVAQHGAAEAVELYQNARRGYYRSLGTFVTFGRGWLRRVDEVEAAAKEMAL